MNEQRLGHELGPVTVDEWTGTTWAGMERRSYWTRSQVWVHDSGAVVWAGRARAATARQLYLEGEGPDPMPQDWHPVYTAVPVLELVYGTSIVAVGWGASPVDALACLQDEEGHRVTLDTLVERHGGLLPTKERLQSALEAANRGPVDV